MLSMALTALWVVLCLGGSSATPVILLSSLEGSTDEDEFGNFTSLPPTSNTSSDYQTTPVGPVHMETDRLSQLMNLLEENMLLILVAGSLILLLLLMICSAIYMSHRRKVNAYYPSSFPSKMYVDHRDKTGGAKPFIEVPEKPAPEQRVEPVDSHRQLQADIMKAAKSLRTANKSGDSAEGSESQKLAEHGPEESSEADGGVLDQQLPSLPEEKEPGEVSDTEPSPQEQPHPEEEDEESKEEEPKEAAPGRSLRPSSLHIHNDSATLQLIAGEKTAF